VSSLLFGLWHVLPTIEVLELNDLYSGSSLAFGGAVTGAVAVTAAAGFGFCWLRLRAGSVLAPVLAHAATNSIAFAAGWLVVDQGWV
jgi:membrane protease YdiL (CAAX protease family)